MCSGEVIVWGTIGLVVGLPGAIWPYKSARWGEILDAIGRKPSGRVEPTDWNVALSRVLGIGLSLFGFIVFFSCFLL